MNRIDKTFARLRAEGKKALLAFVTAGDPSLEGTAALCRALEENGADLIELGIPFSDPIAEGEVISAANERALAAGATLEAIMEAVGEIRKTTQIPLVYLLYYNSILHYGPARFFDRCRAVGVDGVIIPDLPVEEAGELAPFEEQSGVYIIRMVSPTTTDVRMERICKGARGFLYCVSSMGVTGVRQGFDLDFGALYKKLGALTDIPKCIGFGISTPDHIRALGPHADGLIVGSAIVRRVADAPEDPAAAGAFVRTLKNAFGA